MLSGKERDRLKVLHEVQGGHLTQQSGGKFIIGIPAKDIGASYK